MNTLTFNKDSLKTLFAAGIGAILLTVLLISIGSFWLIGRMATTFEYVVDHPLQEISEVAELEHLAVRTSIFASHYLIHSEPIHRQRYTQFDQQLTRTFSEKLALTTLFPEQRRLLQEASDEWVKARTIVQQLPIRPQPQAAGLSEIAASGIERVDIHIHHMLDLLRELHDLTSEEVSEAEEHAITIKNQATSLLSAALVLTLLVAGAGSTFLARGIFRPLRRLEQSVNILAAGDLSHRIELRTPMELARLADRFNAMADELERNHAELKDLSIRDPLTGVLNRRTFRNMLLQEVARAQRQGEAFSLLALDVDHFKRVNDDFGRQAGDDILRAVCSLIREQLRCSEPLARYGGEKFAVIVSKSDSQKALTLAEQLRRTVAEHDGFIANGKPIHITVSIGLASFPGDADTDTKLISAAEQALRAAKASGHDRVSAYRTMP